MLNGLVYNVVARRSVKPKQGNDQSNLEYCDHPLDFQGAGVAVVAAYSWSADSYFVYKTNQLQELQALAAVHDHVFGFNSKLDDQLLATAGCHVQTTYDVCREIKVAAGFARDWSQTEPTERASAHDKTRFNLDLVAKLNLGYGKLGWGNPSKLWQQGKQTIATAHCLHSVKLIKELLERSGVVAGTEGRLLDPNTGKWLYLKPLGVPADAYRSLDAV